MAHSYQNTLYMKSGVWAVYRQCKQDINQMKKFMETLNKYWCVWFRVWPVVGHSCIFCFRHLKNMLFNSSRIHKIILWPQDSSSAVYSRCQLLHCVFTLILEGHTPWPITLLQLEYGEAVWTEVLKRANCPVPEFCTHQVYPDNLMKDIASACAVIINNNSDVEYFMRFFGRCFVRYFSNFG